MNKYTKVIKTGDDPRSFVYSDMLSNESQVEMVTEREGCVLVILQYKTSLCLSTHSLKKEGGPPYVESIAILLEVEKVFDLKEAYEDVFQRLKDIGVILDHESELLAYRIVPESRTILAYHLL